MRLMENSVRVGRPAYNKLTFAYRNSRRNSSLQKAWGILISAQVMEQNGYKVKALVK